MRSKQQKLLPRIWNALAPAFLLATALAACTSTGELSTKLATRDETKQAAIPPAVQREHDRILSAYGGVYDDPRLQKLIEQTVARLVAASDRPDLHYRVTLLNSPSVNAFALPTGQLYVTRGLAALANDTSELASVLSHEMAHVIARHAAIRENQAQRVALIDGVVNNLLSDPESGALALAKSKIALASFSRTQEFEADAIGVEIASHAGFDPYGAERFLESMGRNANLRPAPNASDDPFTADFLSSHPSTPDRVKNVVERARQFSAPGAGERDKADYLTAVNGLVYGEDPNEGYVRGRRYLHPKLGFTFTAPDGFRLDNTSQVVLGTKDGGDEAMRVDVVRVPAEQKLTDYLVSGWMENVDKGSLEELKINGLPAATAKAAGEQWNLRLYVIRLGSEVYRFVFASKHTGAGPDRAFRESVGTFRRMTLDEIRNVRPLRITVVTVTPSDTIARMAARMAVTDKPLQRFLVLNGLAPGGKLHAGDQVKIVTE